MPSLYRNTGFILKYRPRYLNMAVVMSLKLGSSAQITSLCGIQMVIQCGRYR